MNLLALVKPRFWILRAAYPIPLGFIPRSGFKPQLKRFDEIPQFTLTSDRGSNLNVIATLASLQKNHCGLILSRIRAKVGVSRAELARMCGFSKMTATRIVRELLAAGIIEELNA